MTAKPTHNILDFDGIIFSRCDIIITTIFVGYQFMPSAYEQKDKIKKKTGSSSLSLIDWIGQSFTSMIPSRENSISSYLKLSNSYNSDSNNSYSTNLNQVDTDYYDLVIFLT